MFARYIPRTKKNLSETQKTILDKELNNIIVKKNASKDDLKRAMQLLEDGATMSEYDHRLLTLLIGNAHVEYGHDKIDLFSLHDFEQGIQNYNIKCKENPDHSFYIDSIIKQIKQGIFPIIELHVSNIKKSYLQGPLGLILLYKSEAAADLLEAGAVPLAFSKSTLFSPTDHYPYEPLLNIYLSKWLFSVETISTKIVNVLQEYKKLIFCTTRENVIHALNPTTPAGKVVWAGMYENFFNGKREEILKYAKAKFNLSSETIIAELAKQGIIIDKKGQWSKAIEIKTKNAETIKIQPEEKTGHTKKLREIIAKKDWDDLDLDAAIALVDMGADFSINDNALLGKLLKEAHKKYGHNQIDLLTFEKPGFTNLIQKYKNKCEKNPVHANYINAIIKLIELGADPNKPVIVDNSIKGSYVQSSLGMILLYKREATGILLEAGASPLTGYMEKHDLNLQFRYQHYMSGFLNEWLFSTNTITPKIIDTLKNYKNDNYFTFYITPENYADALNPTKPVGQLVWTQTERKDSGFTEGTCDDIVWHLKNNYGISQQTIIAELAKQGIIIDQYGHWSKATNIQQSVKKPMSAELLQGFAAEKSHFLNIFIRNANILDFEKYWENNKNIFMHEAVEHGYTDLIKNLIEYDPDLINARHDDNEHLLHKACRFGNISLVNYLLEKKCDPNVKNGNRFTPLRLAIRYQRTECVKALLYAGANIHGDIYDLEIYKDNPTLIALLMAFGARIEDKNPAEFLQRLIIIKSFLKKAQNTFLLSYPELPSISVQAYELVKALLRAYIDSSFANYKSLATKFLEWISSQPITFSQIRNTAKQYAVDARYSKTFLPLCEFIRSAELAYFLAPYNKNNKQNQLEIDVLANSANPSEKQIIEILPKAIAKPDAKKITEDLLRSFADKESINYINQFIEKAGIEKFETYWQREKNIFMHCLVENGYFEPVKNLIIHDKNLLLAKHYDNQTQLIHSACRLGKENIAVFLLQQGIDIQAKNNLGESPLHLAALGGHVTLVNLLLKHSANVRAKNNDNKTALETLLVTRKDNYSDQYSNIITLLIACGANIPFDYKLSAMTSQCLENVITVAPLLRSALKTSPTDLNQLAKALLLEYRKKSNANYEITAGRFIDWISSNNPILSFLQSTAMQYAQLAISSKSFEPLCRFIGSNQFEYCLAPITNPVAHLKSILEEKDINIHLLKQVLNSLDKDSHYTMLATWLYNLKDISDELVDILKHHKNKIDFRSITTAEKYLHILDPTTAIGRVLWAPRKDIPCTFYAGTCSDLVYHLQQRHKIDQQTIIDNLAAINVKIHKLTGIYTLIEPIKSSSPRFHKAPVNTPNINEALLKNLADTVEEKLLINEFIDKNTTLKFASYWQLNKISFIDKVITTKDMMKLADKLFKYDPDLVNVTFCKDKHLMLHSAAATDNPSWLDFLLKNKIDINCKMKDGYTALHVAVNKGHTDIVSILLASGADVDIKNDLGNTPLELFINNHTKNANSVEIFVKLIVYGADTKFLVTKTASEFPINDVPALRFLLKITNRNLLQIAQEKLKQAISEEMKLEQEKLVRQTTQVDMLELTKKLLEAYINDNLTLHKHKDKAQEFLDDIEAGGWEFDFDDVKEMASELLQKPFMKDSETFRELCEFICTKEFEYFLEPQKDKPGCNNTETAEQFYRNTL